MNVRRVGGIFLLGLTGALAVGWAVFGHRAARAAAAKAAPQQNLPVIRFVKNPEPAPDFSLQGFDGKSISPGDWRGKVTLLNFWATWCGPCRAEIPDLVGLQNKYDGKLQIIGLSVDEGADDGVRRFAQKSGINYPVAMAPAELQARFGGITALPTSFVLDQQGRVVQKHVGLRDPELYENEIRALLGLPVNARVETFEDTGQIFLTNASRATEFPGVDLSKLTPEQRKTALRRFNEEDCTCGCKLTIAQCRINDSACGVSKGLADQIVQEITQGKAAPKKTAAAK